MLVNSGHLVDFLLKYRQLNLLLVNSGHLVDFLLKYIDNYDIYQ